MRLSHAPPLGRVPPSQAQEFTGYLWYNGVESRHTVQQRPNQAMTVREFVDSFFGAANTPVEAYLMGREGAAGELPDMSAEPTEAQRQNMRMRVETLWAGGTPCLKLVPIPGA